MVITTDLAQSIATPGIHIVNLKVTENAGIRHALICMLRTQEGYCDDKRGGRCTCWSVTFEAGYQEGSNIILNGYNKEGT
jgi:hypothetical protein